MMNLDEQAAVSRLMDKVAALEKELAAASARAEQCVAETVERCRIASEKACAAAVDAAIVMTLDRCRVIINNWLPDAAMRYSVISSIERLLPTAIDAARSKEKA